MADLALERKTGARGLRAILEKTLGDIMFAYPSDKTISEVIITGDTVDTGIAEIKHRDGSISV
jgi:ATP-dependent Clp protease ATP-binding subunit ClpX